MTHGLLDSPFAAALRASSPAATITDGLDVLVQLVIAAMTTDPCDSSNVSSPSSTVTFVSRLAASTDLSTNPSHAFFESVRLMRSCGRLGPAIAGTTVDRSSSSVSVNTGSGVSLVRNRPCSLAYASTSATVSSSRLVKRRYLIVSSSIGKNPHVAPYSGAMLAIVARSASVR